jgi:uncharacterized phage protein (TIGR01671 family)
MREIKFRGKRVDNGEWIYGFITIYSKEYFILYVNDEGVGTLHKVDPETVGQFVGKKDKNGIDLWEGDLIKEPVRINQDYHGEYSIKEILYKHGEWIASHISSEKGKLPRGYMAGFLIDSFEYDAKLFFFSKDYVLRTDIEKIGNLHDNKDLLK